MPDSSIIKLNNNISARYEWTAFKKFINGENAYLSYIYQDFGSHYLIVTELFGGILNECLLKKDNGAYQIDFETNYKNVSFKPPEKKDKSLENEIFRYDILDTHIYTGRALAGSLVSQAVWTIERIILSNGLPTLKQRTNNVAIWNNRVTEIYK